MVAVSCEVLNDDAAFETLGANGVSSNQQGTRPDGCDLWCQANKDRAALRQRG